MRSVRTLKLTQRTNTYFKLDLKLLDCVHPYRINDETITAKIQKTCEYWNHILHSSRYWTFNLILKGLYRTTTIYFNSILLQHYQIILAANVSLCSRLIIIICLCHLFSPSGDSDVEQEVKTDREVREEQLNREKYIYFTSELKYNC